MRFGGYEIGDKVVYTNSFTKPTLGKVVYYINENYLIDFTNNTRKWATDKELIRYSKENYLKRIVEKYLKEYEAHTGRRCQPASVRRPR